MNYTRRFCYAQSMHQNRRIGFRDHRNAQKKSSSVTITLLLKVDLEGFEPLTSRMRTERSPNSLAFVHTLCTVRKEKSTYIRPYKMFRHPNDLSRSQVWSPSRGFSRWCSLGRNMVGGQVSYRPLRCNSLGVQMYRIPIHNKIRCTVKARLSLGKNGSCVLFWLENCRYELTILQIKDRLKDRDTSF